MIGAEDFLITDSGLLKAGELVPGTSVLGLTSSTGSLVWSQVQEVKSLEKEAVRVYGNQSEFTLFEDSVVLVSGRGPVKLYGDIVNSNIYHSNYKIETARKTNVHVSDKWSSAEDPTAAWTSDLDFRILGLMVRRLPLKRRLVIRIPKDRYSNLSYLFPSSMKLTLFSGDYWDWLRIESGTLLDGLTKYWSVPSTIPSFVRRSGFQRLMDFYHGVMLVTSEDNDGIVFHRTFEDERDTRELLCNLLSLSRAHFALNPTPLYCPDEVSIAVTGRPLAGNLVRTSKFIGQATGISIRSEHSDWFPLVNLSLVA